MDNGDWPKTPNPILIFFFLGGADARMDLDTVTLLRCAAVLQSTTLGLHVYQRQSVKDKRKEYDKIIIFLKKG